MNTYGINLEAITAVRPVADKIIDGLKKSEKVPGFLTFSMFLAKVLDEKDFEMLEALEQANGEKFCNDWLCDIMVESGRYQRDGESVFPVG